MNVGNQQIFLQHFLFHVVGFFVVASGCFIVFPLIHSVTNNRIVGSQADNRESGAPSEINTYNCGTRTMCVVKVLPFRMGKIWKRQKIVCQVPFLIAVILHIFIFIWFLLWKWKNCGADLPLPTGEQYVTVTLILPFFHNIFF